MTTLMPVQGLAVGRGRRLLAAVALLMVVAFTITTLPGVRSTTSFHVLYDGWVQGGAYVVLAFVALVRPLASGVNRTLWWLVATGSVLRALGYVLFLGYVRLLDNPPSPSVADVAWFLEDLVMLAAMWVLLRTRIRSRSVDLALDALVVGLTVGGVAVMLLYPTLVDIANRPDPGQMVATELIYPMLDIAALVIVTGVLVRLGWRSWSTVLLTVGIAADAIVDAVFAYQSSAGTYHPGTILAALALMAGAAMAFAGWAPEGEQREPHGYEFSRVAVAAVLGLVAVAALVYADLTDVPVGGVLLLAAALVVGIGRAMLTVSRNRGTAESAISAKDAELLRFQSLVETSDDFIAMVRPDGAVLYVNPAGRRLVGIEGRDVTRMRIADFMTEEGLAASVGIEQPAVMKHGRWSGQSTLRDHRGGAPIPVAISSFLMRDPDTGEPFALATVQRDISDRVAAQSAVEWLADERQRLLDRLVQAQEDERARIASDVHDDSVQALAAVELRLGLLRRQLGDSRPELNETAETLAGTVRDAIGRLRALLFDLESPAVGTDLATALSVAAEDAFEERIRWRVTGDTGLDLPQSQRVTAYRIAREAMANVVRHADARAVEIRLSQVGSGVEVAVEDDGRGFDPATVESRPGHLGIPAMADRATIAGGRLEIQRRDEGGTRVRIWLPSPLEGDLGEDLEGSV
ncbi:MAG TPA: PAS domain-containing sensor histidine kinase [Nocardioides sp.]|jgi:PAS domain S-box-containing protein|nr:PAS domain-containing sensor histidine kinase [Nocardioides sp.]